MKRLSLNTEAKIVKSNDRNRAIRKNNPLYAYKPISRHDHDATPQCAKQITFRTGAEFYRTQEDNRREQTKGNTMEHELGTAGESAVRGLRPVDRGCSGGRLSAGANQKHGMSEPLEMIVMIHAHGYSYRPCNDCANKGVRNVTDFADTCKIGAQI